MGVEFISEAQDNFRNHENKKNKTKEEEIIDYLQNDNQKLTRKKIYNNMIDKEQMDHFTTEYRQLAKNINANDLQDFYDKVTPAGKRVYLPETQKGEAIISPEFLKKTQIDEKIKDVWHSKQLEMLL